MSQPLNQAIDTMLAEGYQQLQAGGIEKAIEVFSTCLVMEPREARAFRGRGFCHAQLKQWDKAADDFSSAKQINPDDVDSWIELGISLAMQNEIYPAIRVFEELLAMHPGSSKAHLQLGLLYLKLCMIRKGRDELQAAVACHPTLAQRRLIEETLYEQDKLDRGRYYRPDFEALHRQKSGAFDALAAWWKGLTARRRTKK